MTFRWKTEHFSGKNGALKWSILVGNKSIMYKSLDGGGVPRRKNLRTKQSPVRFEDRSRKAPFLDELKGLGHAILGNFV